MGNNLLSEEFKSLSTLKGKKVMYSNDGEIVHKSDEVITESYVKRGIASALNNCRKRVKSVAPPTLRTVSHRVPSKLSIDIK